VGDGVLAIANFSKACFGETPKPTRETRALPGRRSSMTPTLQLCLIISAALFSIGLLAALSRRHAIFILIGIELMLAAANLNFIAFWRFGPVSPNPTGVMVAIFSIAIAAAEAAVGLALVIAVYRHYRTTNVRRFNQLKG
jgi:NADH-quinone oxidoreductase subunit K